MEKIRGVDIEIVCKNKMEHLLMESLLDDKTIKSAEDAEKSLCFVDEVENAVNASNIADDKKTNLINILIKLEKC